jgi:hypothetical protein
MNATNMTTSFSNRVKMRRNPLSRRAVRSHCVAYTELDRMPMARVDSAWAAPPAHILTPRPVAASHRLHTLDPSTGESGAGCDRSVAGAFAPRMHRGPGRGTGQTLWPFEHPRQPDESWSSIRRGTGQWPAGRFF